MEGGVHGAAADEGSLAVGEGEAGEVVGAGDGGGGEVGGCCGAVAEGGEDTVGVDAVSEGVGGQGGFEREGVFVQPGEEGGFAEDAGVGELGGVDVCICGFGVEGRVNSRSKG